ncbi:hypothetical protein H8958_020960 [Nasalis larvatus]
MLCAHFSDQGPAHLTTSKSAFLSNKAGTHPHYPPNSADPRRRAEKQLSVCGVRTHPVDSQLPDSRGRRSSVLQAPLPRRDYPGGCRPPRYPIPGCHQRLPSPADLPAAFPGPGNFSFANGASPYSVAEEIAAWRAVPPGKPARLSRRSADCGGCEERPAQTVVVLRVNIQSKVNQALRGSGRRGGYSVWHGVLRARGFLSTPEPPAAQRHRLTRYQIRRGNEKLPASVSGARDTAGRQVPADKSEEACGSLRGLGKNPFNHSAFVGPSGKRGVGAWIKFRDVVCVF